MADLPKYQQTGRVMPDMPQLDFANVREAFRASQSMTQGLDKISSFAFGKMGEQAEKDAIKNAISQPLTLEQIQQANQRGESVTDLLDQVGGGQIYQDTYRKIQGKQLRSELEITAQQALSSIQSQVTLGQINDVNVISSKFDSIISGFSKPLEALSPEEAVNFKQSMATTANSFFKDSIKTLEKRTLAYNQVLSQENFNYSVDAAESMINTTLDPAMLKESKQMLGLRVFEQALSGGETFAMSQLTEFNKAFDNSIANKFEEVIFADGFTPKLESGLPDFNTAMRKINAGDLGDASELWKEYPQDKKDAIAKEAFNKLTSDYAAYKKTIEINKESKEAEAKAELIALSNNTYSRKETKTRVDKLFTDGYITWAQHEEIANPSPKEIVLSNAQKIQMNLARNAIASNRIKSVEQLNKAYAGVLPIVKLSELYQMVGNTDKQEAERLIIKYSGLDVDPYQKSAETIENNVYYRRGLDRKLKERNDDGTPVYTSTTDAVNDLFKEIQDTKIGEKAITNQKSKYAELKAEGFNPDNGGFDAWLNRQNYNDDKKNSLRVAYKKYQNAKVVTGLNYNELIQAGK